MNEAKKIKINFKMPPESAADRAHRLHQQIRKKSGLPDPEEYRRRAAEKQKEIDAMKEAAAIPVGQHDQSISNKAKSQKSSAETRARAMGAAAATRSKNAALRDVIKEPDRDVREAALTHYVKVNNALKTTPSGAHIMKFPDRESAQRHADEHKRRNPNHNVTVTTNATDSTPVWHSGTKLRPYAMREGIAMQQQEAKDSREYDYEGDMAKSQLRAIIANAQQVHDMLEDNTNMAEWVQSKITLAADYISTVADYMQAEVKEETELEEAIKLGSKVMIHAPGKSYHGKTGQVGEIRNGAFKGAPKTYTVDHDNGSIQLSQKNVKLHKEDMDIDEAAWGQDKMANLKAAHDRHSEKAIKANRAGDDAAVKVHQRKMGLIKTQMNKLRTEDVAIDESTKDHIEQSLAAKDINAKVEGDKVHVHPDNLSKARYALDKMGMKHTVHGTLKDSVEYCHWEIIDEAWSQGKRNPQRGIKVGDKVRSYDFPGMHDDHYVEGHVVRDTPSSYHLRVNKVVRSGKEIPVPAHMAHVEAPKGKGLFSDAYAVHKIMAKQQSVSAVQEPVMGAQKTFAKIRGKE
jgi:ribosomal protein L21E